MNQKKISSLQESLSSITDVRQASGRRYELVAVLLLCCVGLMTGYKSVNAIAEWGKNYGAKWLKILGLTRKRSPSQPTLHRILKQVSIEELETCLGHWASAVLGGAENRAEELEAAAMDGKKLRGSFRHEASGSYLLSVMSQRLGVVLAEVAIAAGENEITQAEAVIEKICLEGVVLTADALHTQTALAERIVDKGGDYLLVVKGNQPKLFEDIRYCFEHDRLVLDTIKEAVDVDQHGNRIEERRLRSTSILKDYVDFPFVEQVLEIRRIVRDKKSGMERTEIGYAVTSLAEERLPSSC
jgi:predicted transposase YbfD/YdcC